MRAVIVYESMYGNTHEVAQRIADGLRTGYEVALLPVHEATSAVVADADLLLVGGPTHAHGMTTSATRKSARDAAAKPGSALQLESDTDGAGLRDWFNTLGTLPGTKAAAFDTRFDAVAVFTGHAGKGISHRLRRHRCTMVADPESFLVDKHTVLLPGEADRAEQWGRRLAASVLPQRQG